MNITADLFCDGNARTEGADQPVQVAWLAKDARLVMRGVARVGILGRLRYFARHGRRFAMVARQASCTRPPSRTI